jgi:hypothetical protein
VNNIGFMSGKIPEDDIESLRVELVGKQKKEMMNIINELRSDNRVFWKESVMKFIRANAE